MAIPEKCEWQSAQLTVFAAPAIVAAVGDIGVLCALAINAQTHTRDGFTAGFRNGGIAFLAMFQTLAAGQFSACAGDGLFNAGVDLILHRAIPAPASGHTNLVSQRLMAYFSPSLPALRANSPYALYFELSEMML
jgi:hypothetical protein